MPKKMRHVGLDVHAETIAVAVAGADGSVRELGTMRHRPEAVRKLIAKLGGPRDCACATRPGRPAIRSTGSSPRWGPLRRDRAEFDTDQGRRSREDRPQGRGAPRALLSR